MNYDDTKITSIKKQFSEKKFVILKNFLTLSEVNHLLNDFTRFQNDEFGSALKRQGKTRFVLGNLPGELGKIYRNEKIVKIVQAILGENVALYFHRLLIKDPDSPQTVTPHQDMTYFHGTTEKVTIFVFLNGNKKEDGGMVFVPSSSQFGLLPRGNLNLENLPNLSCCSPELSPHDIVISDFLTWHWSWPQVNPIDRPIIQLSYQKSDDGSFEDRFIEGPTLVSGKWQTSYFIPASKVIPSEKFTPTNIHSISAKEYEIECGT